MEIIRFSKINGITPMLLEGTDRYAYGLSDFVDFWELDDWQAHGGYASAVLYFFDIYENEIYQPFDLERHVTYQMPLFSDDQIYFLQMNFDTEFITLYRYCLKGSPEIVTQFSVHEVNLYNLGLKGAGVHVVSQDERFICYYPEQFEIELATNESVMCIDEDYVYINAWVEEGTYERSDYRYYEKLIVKNKKGQLISEEIGSLNQFPDGKWRLT